MNDSLPCADEHAQAVGTRLHAHADEHDDGTNPDGSSPAEPVGEVRCERIGCEGADVLWAHTPASARPWVSPASRPHLNSI